MSTELSAPKPLRLLCVVTRADAAWAARLAALETSPWGPFVLERCADHESAAERLAQAPVDAVLAGLPVASWPGLPQTALNAAVVLVAPEAPQPHAVTRLLSQGVQDVLPVAELHGDALPRALRLAVERKRIEREARKAYATDLATGLPNHMQLAEHMSHLLALREREPAPMALLVLRLEGLATTEARLGRESANVLRRKVAVRLRAGVRASDVVASLGIDAFAVLLSAIEEPSHAHRVAQKLANALHQPFNVAGHSVGVAVGVGAALYPADGKQADALLRRASGAAAMTPAVGRAGFANHGESGTLPQAANDDDGSLA
ncbi:GGDEF domain-containing protein [Ideonella sp. BN130291]|uniref:GGDEF domain-containing protein n=1 Tax=Ideonella sp. BN130291 TaxID=3112940 RepID=UPI002E25DD80|nr:GGDEF domain-containing protein [Ideonella sp. BN130291]